MVKIAEEAAIISARGALQIERNVPARAWLVQRLDHPGKSYFLVVFGQENASLGLAVVDSDTGEIKNSARLPGTAPHLTMNAEHVLSLMGENTEAVVDLVWKPCGVTRSPFYPLWRIQRVSETIYIDQHGNIQTDLNRS